MYVKFSEKLTFLTPWYAHVRVRIRGLEMLVFRKILRTYLMDEPKAISEARSNHSLVSQATVLQWGVFLITVFWTTDGWYCYYQQQVAGYISSWNCVLRRKCTKSNATLVTLTLSFLFSFCWRFYFIFLKSNFTLGFFFNCSFNFHVSPI